MAKPAAQSAKMQTCRALTRSTLSADDLLVLLAVGRSGRYVTAAEELGINHTTIAAPHRRARTVARRAAAGAGRGRLGAHRSRTRGARRRRGRRGRGPLADRGPGGPRGARRRGPDVGDRRLQRLHRRARRRRGAATATRRWRSRSSPRPAARHSSGPASTSRSSSANRRCTAPRPSASATTALGSVRLTRLPRPNTARPTSRADLAGHPLVYFIDSMLQVDDLDLARTFAPGHAGIRHVHQRLRPRRGDPGRRGARACCRASWPTDTTTWSGCCPTPSRCS